MRNERGQCGSGEWDLEAEGLTGIANCLVGKKKVLSASLRQRHNLNEIGWRFRRFGGETGFWEGKQKRGLRGEGGRWMRCRGVRTRYRYWCTLLTLLSLAYRKSFRVSSPERTPACGVSSCRRGCQRREIACSLLKQVGVEGDSSRGRNGFTELLLILTAHKRARSSREKRSRRKRGNSRGRRRGHLFQTFCVLAGQLHGRSDSGGGSHVCMCWCVVKRKNGCKSVEWMERDGMLGRATAALSLTSPMIHDP
jgi:hypothetical protein